MQKYSRKLLISGKLGLSKSKTKSIWGKLR